MNPDPADDLREMFQKGLAHAPIVVIGHMFHKSRCQNRRPARRTPLDGRVHAVMPIDTPVAIDQRGEPVAQTVDDGISYWSTFPQSALSQMTHPPAYVHWYGLDRRDVRNHALIWCRLHHLGDFLVILGRGD